MELRKMYCEELARLMKQNDKIVVLDADLAGAIGTKPLYEQFPDRCIECGIAEANMACIAAGLSAQGFIPFIHTFSPFIARRALDQIAVSMCYSEQNVKMMGADPGVFTAKNGGTHMSFEDVAALRALNNVAIIDVVDGMQLVKALPYVAESYGNMFLRYERKQTKQYWGEDYEFNFGKIDKIQNGKDITIIASGSSLFDALEAAETLKQQGVSVELLSVHTIKPLDEAAVVKSAKKTGRVLTVENHSIHGGLYGAVCETLSAKHPTLCDAVAVRDKITQVGTADELKRDYNLTAKDIVVRAKALLKK